MRKVAFVFILLTGLLLFNACGKKEEKQEKCDISITQLKDINLSVNVKSLDNDTILKYFSVTNSCKSVFNDEISINTDAVIYQTQGDYTLSVSYEDVTEDFTVSIKDTTKPELIFDDTEIIIDVVAFTHDVKTQFNGIIEGNVIVQDNYDNISLDKLEITYDENYLMSFDNTFKVYYRYTDEAGNTTEAYVQCKFQDTRNKTFFLESDKAFINPVYVAGYNISYIQENKFIITDSTLLENVYELDHVVDYDYYTKDNHIYLVILKDDGNYEINQFVINYVPNYEPDNPNEPYLVEDFTITNIVTSTQTVDSLEDIPELADYQQYTFTDKGYISHFYQYGKYRLYFINEQE